jgi:hypothetical protein
MKVTKIFIFTAFTATLFAAVAFINVKPVAPKVVAGKGFAVVELFTSEGCSSCPPADELVSRIQKEYNDQPVYILAYHVDYWNRLGWKDVFSSADYSKRQNTYSHYLNAEVYTPQIVVNGKKEFVGSEEGTLRNAIKSNIVKASSVQITLSDIENTGSQVKLHYKAEGNGGNSMLLLALVQRSAQTKVKAGENNGHTLSHVQIVRQLQSVALSNDKSGVESITLPVGFNARGYEIIGLIQNTQTGEIVAATKAQFQTGI